MKWLIRTLDFRLFNGAGQGGGGGGGGNGGGNGGAGAGAGDAAGGGAQNGGGDRWAMAGMPRPAPTPAPAPAAPAAPAPPPVRAARNVQRANIDRSAFYEPSTEALQMGREYLQSRSATFPRPAGDRGVGAVGYEFTPSNERLY